MTARCAGAAARCHGMAARYRASVARYAGGIPWRTNQRPSVPGRPRAVRWSRSPIPWNDPAAPREDSSASLDDRSAPRSHSRECRGNPVQCLRSVSVRYVIAMEPWRSLGKFLCDCRDETEHPAECKNYFKLFSWRAGKPAGSGEGCDQTGGAPDTATVPGACAGQTASGTAAVPRFTPPLQFPSFDCMNRINRARIPAPSDNSLPVTPEMEPLSENATGS